MGEDCLEDNNHNCNDGEPDDYFEEIGVDVVPLWDNNGESNQDTNYGKAQGEVVNNSPDIISLSIKVKEPMGFEVDNWDNFIECNGEE